MIYNKNQQNKTILGYKPDSPYQGVTMVVVRGRVRDSGSRLNGGCTRKVPRQWLHEGGTTMVARGGTVVV